MVAIAVAGGLGRTVYFWRIVVVVEVAPGLELVVVDAVDVVAGAAVVVVLLPKYSRARTRQQCFVGHSH